MDKSIADRVSRVESLISAHQHQLDEIGIDVKNIRSEIHSIFQWISEKFGVGLISPVIKSQLSSSREQFNPSSSTLSLVVVSNPIVRHLYDRKDKAKSNLALRHVAHNCSESQINSAEERKRSLLVPEPSDLNSARLAGQSFIQPDIRASKLPVKCRGTGLEASFSSFSRRKLIPDSHNSSLLIESHEKQTKAEIKTSVDLTISHKRNEEPSEIQSDKQDEQSLENLNAIQTTTDSSNDEKSQIEVFPYNSTPDETDIFRKEKTPMICDECGKVLKSASSLRCHKQIHSNTRPFDCKDCGKAFKLKHHLDFHRLTHEGAKKWTCRFCEKGFIARRDLLRHERTHTGEKPFPCSFPNCTKSFNVKQHLILHFRTHTGERPYRCSICDKTFTQANSLRIHRKIHAKDEVSSEVQLGKNA